MRKKALYLEFNGVPGCGKSTICKALLDELNKYNFRYYDYQNLFLNFIKKRMWKMQALFMLLNINGIRILYNTHKAVNQLGLSRDNRKFVPYLILTQLLITYFGKKYSDSILVSDEGIVQYVISMLYDQKITNETHLDCTITEILSMSNYVDMIAINVEIKSELAISRIREREDGKSRLDHLDNNSLKYIMDIQIANFMVIRKYISNLSHVDINVGSDIESNVRVLLDQVMERRHNEMGK